MRVPLCIFIIVLLCHCLPASAASVRVEWENDSETRLRTLGGEPLTPGPERFQSDGAILGLGSYTLGTTANPFAGNWVPLTGPGTSNLETTIGDKVVAADQAGLFNLSTAFADSGSHGPFPQTGTPLVIRYYDSTSLETSTYFNAVSNTSGSWNWIDPTDPQTVLYLALTDPGLVWQDGPGSAFRTTIPIPEPGIAVLGLATLLVLAWRRRR